jgi:hypothetical protein
MKLSLAIAEKLHLLAQGEQMPASKLKHNIIAEMVADGIITARFAGLTKSTLYIADVGAFNNYLYNKCSITDLPLYIATLKNTEATRADFIEAGNDSKLSLRRTFKGFLVNSYMRGEALLRGEAITIHPLPGTFQFIYDPETFLPASDVIIAGVENAENFCQIEKLRYLFPQLKLLFVCRYPQAQSRDLIKWLQAIPNAYLHLGDYDFAGINIYLQEYKKHLGDKASFFVPPNIERLLEKHGNKALYDQQHLNNAVIEEAGLQQLVALIHKHKKGLEQEILLIQ